MAKLIEKIKNLFSSQWVYKLKKKQEPKPQQEKPKTEEKPREQK